ncbi:ArsR/SmtB family transcription factor [Janibacter cremeus]|uniref:DNA-binding transcriptional ArsR family regulator n=1 Tax=Janibacter cremeus TaxID=1285192 RepID=A0A852VQ38_9MICO|nr:helix-turn-helix domain-containing protein [Janibacter cremeus]NYF98019.1 DNA-binding transcriptional ArsR family regulator [Janibacter cremeus]
MIRRKRTELNITEARALRTLAHPARQRLITELYSGEVLTATEAAELVGLTPSATSYHLRALEKAGIVVRDEGTSDARQRPWRAAADSLSVRPEAYRHSPAGVQDANLAGWSSDIQAGMERAERAMAAGRDDVGHMSHSRLWLTWQEVEELADRIMELTEEYKVRTRADHPEGARAWDAYRLVLPTKEIPDTPREDR